MSARRPYVEKRLTLFRTCGTCGAVCGREDKFCRSCGQPLE